MKLPKKIKLLNRIFEVIRTDDLSLAYFMFRDPDNDGKPTIGIKKKLRDEDLIEAFIHEITELIYELLRVRYTRPDDSTAFEFHYTHKEHDTAAKMLAGVILELIRVNNKK